MIGYQDVDELERLVNKGNKIFSLPEIGDKINYFSDLRPAEEYRRQSDFIEICTALAVLAEKYELSESLKP